MIEFERVKSDLLELLRIDAPSYREAAAAGWLAAKLAEFGVEARDDGTGGALQGNSGNLVARIPGNHAPALLLNAHLDNVPPCEGVNPVVEGDIVRTDGRTVLGGDDKCGCIAILAALREVVTAGLAHPPLEVVFTAAEETGLEGAQALDYSTLTARQGIVAESGSVGAITVKAPSADRWDAVLKGRAAHAGVAPEKGINAIRMAAEAIAEMRVGRLDEETTANVGLIHAGEARNVVPPTCTVSGEARSHDRGKLDAQVSDVRRCLEEAARRHGGEVEWRVSRTYEAFDIPREARSYALAEAGAREVGLDPIARPTGGGSDANIFNAHGIECVILGCSSSDVHTTEEHVSLSDLHRACEWLARIIEIAGRG
ncbi:MAG: M20/M25/M40 family metallo-hydrolase [Armatimonadetes bacterium]|nr:M20/M25/M40 family metallo-hydrolase [Armatimonadota bacterium]